MGMVPGIEASVGSIAQLFVAQRGGPFQSLQLHLPQDKQRENLAIESRLKIAG